VGQVVGAASVDAGRNRAGAAVTRSGGDGARGDRARSHLALGRLIDAPPKIFLEGGGE
jgi:hypothetical protein